MVETETYGVNSITFQSVNTWNELQQTTDFDLTELDFSKAKQKISEFIMNTYNT